MKLVRPLHRQRTRKRNEFQVLSGEALASHFEVSRANLEAYLDAAGIAYHKDSRGELWASIAKRRPLTEPESR
jgi:hypothetical protein